MLYSKNELLLEAKNKLNKNGIDEREARLLLAFAIGVTSDELVKYSEVSSEIKDKFYDVIEKRIARTPYAYITGTKEFMKLNFVVNENVLIPRPETELLVEEALKTNAISILDMCTGSGCIAISIAHYNKEANVTAVDISKEALSIAKENAKNIGAKVEFIESDLFENVKGKFDLIISNPPYIKTKVIDELEGEVKKEPIIALDGGENGLEFYERIAQKAREHLNENGTLIFEIGFDEAYNVEEILKRNNYKNIEVRKDLSGNDRMIICKK